MPEKIAWPKWLNPKEQTRYVFEVHGIKVTKRKIALDRAKGKGPEVRYLGRIPLATSQALDNYAARVLTDKSPLIVAREQRQAAGFRSR